MATLLKVGRIQCQNNATIIQHTVTEHDYVEHPGTVSVLGDYRLSGIRTYAMPIIAYHLPDDLQARVEELVEKNGEGQLTFDEQQALFDFLRADYFIVLLKTKLKLRKSLE
ncbi:MAG: hypothetical protein H7Y11_01655 [Armatimonadetes bacterium]|nr:hypothetical protein [Anaerolineae bacterium]